MSTNPYDNIEYSNDDALVELHEEYDDVSAFVEERIIRNQLPQVRQLDDFLSNERFQIEKGDPRMNLWEQGGRFRKVFLKTEDVQIAFNLIDQVRRAGIKGHWTEKQHSGTDGAAPACMMVDVDIYQEEQDSKLSEKHISRLQHELSQLFMKRFRPSEPPGGEIVVYSDVRRKPSVKWDEKKQEWKDGFQMFIYARLTRDEKRFFIHEILKEKIFTKTFGKEYKNAESFLDTQCCHVPTLLFGSCKQDSVPKPMWLVYQWHIEEDGTCIIQKDEHFAKSGARLNFTLELSNNFTGRVIKKLQWTAKDDYVDQIALMSRKAKDTTCDDRQTLIDELNHLTVNDPDADYIKSILDCLKPERYNNHKLKFNVVYALVKHSEQYIPLAKLFMKKSHKYTDSKFEEVLAGVRKADYKLSLENLYHWASKDSPEKYRVCGDRSCFIKMSNDIFNGISDGKLGHAHYAEIVHMFMKNKYKTDMRGSKRVWFEFKFPTDPLERGQVYKWCEVSSPDGLDTYLHRKLSGLCHKMIRLLTQKVKESTDKVIDAIAKKIDGAQEKATKAYYTQILKNFKSSCNGLWADGFKQGILKQSEKIFSCPGFIKELDQGLMDVGVGNGILQLSWEGKLPKIIKSYNNTKVSRYTSTPYKLFDPKDPLTRKLLRGLRSMHPDLETDAYEYLMCSMAGSIDNRSRETLMFMVTGVGSNGKSFRFELHAAAMGETYCAQMPIALLLQSKEDSGEAPKPFMMKLEAARSAYYEEGPTCAVLYMPMVKRVTGCGNLPARNLFQEARTIKSRCYHYVLSNHDFIVLSHEEAVWRRLRYLWQSMIFKDKLEYNPSNPRHRLMDRSFNQEFMYEEATRTAYLSIMTFQHMKLMKYHGGVIEHVPHPTVDRHTLEFRNRQDTLNRFVTERIVVSPNQELETPLDKIVEQYCTWYDANVRVTKHFKQDIFKQLMDSGLKDIIGPAQNGTYNMKAGYRVVDDSEALEGEEPYVKTKNTQHKKQYASEFLAETPDEYLERVEREWETLMQEEADVDIDLKGTYSYESDDPDQQDGDIPNDRFVKKDLPTAEPDPDDILAASESDDDTPLSEQVRRTLDTSINDEIDAALQAYIC